MSDRSASPELITTRFDGPAPEVAVSTDMIKRGLIVAPLLIAVCGVIGDWTASGRAPTGSLSCSPTSHWQPRPSPWPLGSRSD